MLWPCSSYHEGRAWKEGQVEVRSTAFSHYNKAYPYLEKGQGR